jgi:hypothetical protein
MIFLSVLTYELGRQLGVEAAAREFARMVTAPPKEPRLPAASVAYNLQRLSSLEQVMLYHPFGTRLPQLRSRCAHAMLQSEADVWVMVDDDVATDAEVLRAMLAVARSPEHPTVILPCLVRGARGEERLNVEFGSAVIQDIAGQPVTRLIRGGCGLMVVHRSALVQASSYAQLYRDDDGEVKRAFFRDILESEDVSSDGGERWLGEDLSFCARLSAAGVLLVAPAEGQSFHAGMVLNLGSGRRTMVQGEVRV